jgi:hypothetical protein
LHRDNSDWYGDPELVQLAQAAEADLGPTFGLNLRGPCGMRWGAKSTAYLWPTRYEIEIAEAARGRPWLAEHVRHEVLHVLYGRAGHPAEINGVVVAAHVPSWTREVNHGL